MTSPTVIESVPAEPLTDPVGTVTHFLELAHRGRLSGICAAPAEQAAALLAEVVADHAHVLDDRAIDGLIGFVLLAKSRPTSAAALAGGFPLTDEVLRS